MPRQASSKVTESARAPKLPSADLRGLPGAVGQRGAKPAFVQGEVNRELRQRMISEAAYEIYAQRGYVDGFELADWLQAEAEVDRLLGKRTTVN